MRRATETDNDQLLELTRLTPMPGRVGLRIDRDPDFFRLVAMRGDGRVFVVEEDGRLVGSITVTRRPAWAAGKIRTLWYVGDLKVHPDCRSRGIGGLVAGEAFDYIVSEGADLLLCVVSAGNDRVVRFLEGRYQIPAFQRVARMTVLQVLCSRGRGRTPYTVRPATLDDAEGVAGIYGETARRYELAPVLTEEDWSGLTQADPAVCRTLVAEREGNVHAAVCVCDGQWAKQHVVVSMPRSLALAASAIRPLGGLAPAFRLPRAGETVPMLFLRHLCAREGHLDGLRALVQASRRRAFEIGYPLVVYGLHAEDPHRAAFRGFPRFAMGSELFLTSLGGNTRLVEAVSAGVPLEDYAVA